MPELAEHLPSAPLAAFLQERVERLGSVKAVALACDCDPASIRRLEEKVSLEKADRWITALGWHLSEIYPEAYE